MSAETSSVNSAANRESSSALPAHASVVVIGGGVMGCSTLYQAPLTQHQQ